MEYTHDNLYGIRQEIGESGILYEQVPINSEDGIFAFRNVREAPSELYRFQKHCQNAIEILYPQTNQISMWMDGKEYLIHPKEAIIINPGTVHSPGSPEGTLHVDTYVIMLDPLKLKWMSNDKEFNFKKEIIPSSSQIQKSLDILLDAYFHGNDMQRKGALLFLMGTLAKDYYLAPQKRTSETRIIRVLNYVEGHFSDETLSPYTIAEQENISYSHFIREFRQNMGITFKDYLTQLRLRKGLNDLLYTNLSITETSMKNGFSNVHAFMTACRRFLDMSPSEYRSLYRK